MIAPLIVIIALLIALAVVQSVDNWMMKLALDAAERRERING